MQQEEERRPVADRRLYHGDLVYHKELGLCAMISDGPAWRTALVVEPIDRSVQGLMAQRADLFQPSYSEVIAFQAAFVKPRGMTP